MKSAGRWYQFLATSGVLESRFPVTLRRLSAWIDSSQASLPDMSGSGENGRQAGLSS